MLLHIYAWGRLCWDSGARVPGSASPGSVPGMEPWRSGTSHAAIVPTRPIQLTLILSIPASNFSCSTVRCMVERLEFEVMLSVFIPSLSNENALYLCPLSLSLSLSNAAAVAVGLQLGCAPHPRLPLSELMSRGPPEGWGFESKCRVSPG